MNKLKNIVLKMIILVLIIILIFSIKNSVEAKASKEDLEEQLEYYSRNIDLNNITKEDILEAYDELSRQYTNEEIANIIEENAEEIEKQGISKEIISAGANYVRTTDTDSVRDILENDIDIEEIKEKIDEGYTTNQIVKDIAQDTPTDKKIEILVKLLLANKIIKIVAIVISVLFIYETILRWIIYIKAGRHGWAAIVPLYRQIVMYKICDLSPWLILIWAIPIFGWLAMFVIAIMKRFLLSKSFGKGSLFGFGLLILPVIFQSVLAFNPNIKYEGDK